MRSIVVCALLCSTAFAAPKKTGPVSASARDRVLPGPDGVVTYECRDVDSGEHIPCKITFIGSHGTPTPSFTRNDIGRQEGDAVAAWNRLMSASGEGYIRLPAGTYDVWISRGPEWDLWTGKALKVGGAPLALSARLKHVVETSGWMSGDFHVHAAASSDSQVPMQDRIYEFLSDGVELIVSTDHNVVSDYAPIIASLGVGRYITSLAGDEMTTNGWGHFGAFPLPHDLERAGQGAILVHGRTATDFFADVRKVAPLAIIDVHHPRIDTEIGYFNLTHFDGPDSRSDRPGFSFDFDALEVLNGYQDSERKSVDKVIADWFALIEHGHIVTATGNSDTHHLDHNIGGYPRNYFATVDDDPSRLQPNALPRALHDHRSFLTTAPFVRFKIDAANIGDTVTLKHGHGVAQIEVQAAPWVTVSTVTVLVDGREWKKIPVPASTERVRLATSVDLDVSKDTYVVVRVDGNQPLAPIVGDQIHFDVRPFALTNPIFLDVDGNGRYDAPFARKPAR